MRRHRWLVVLLVLPVASASAQPLSELAPGARVRVQAPGIVAGRYTGTVLSRTADTLVVASSAAAAVRVPIAALTSVEVSRGRSRSRGALKGVAWGAPIGLAVGLLLGAAASGDEFADGGSRSEFVAASIFSGALWGVIIGAIAGSERWDQYELPRRAALLIPWDPRGGRLGLRVALGR